MLSVLQWFIGLGSTVFLPIIIFILGIIFGVKPAKAAISGFTVGIGSIGLNLVIGLLSDNLGTAIQVMGEHYTKYYGYWLWCRWTAGILNNIWNYIDPNVIDR